MYKRGLLLVLAVAFLSFASAGSIEPEIQKITHYAEEYETGNINYLQFLTYTSAVRGQMNEILGALEIEGGLLKEEQLRQGLGEPNEWTKWVWVEKEEREKRIDKEIPVWKKLIFDGKKIQVRIEAFPSIFKKKDEELLIYHLNFQIEFKKPEEQLNIESKISEIKELAKNFNADPSSANAELLAKESVNAERTFENLFRQSSRKCMDVMSEIFGSENRRESQKLLVEEVSLYQGENFETIGRLEFCEDCRWNWINLDFWVNGRGPGFKMPKEEPERVSEESFKGMPFENYEKEIKELWNNIIELFNKGDISGAIRLKGKLFALNNAWNDRANNVWEELDKEFKIDMEGMSEEERRVFNENYGWLKLEKEKRDKEKLIRKENYEKRKNFYLGLLYNYEKKEQFYEQIEFEKRLIEEFKEFGEEVCNNGADDNKNEKIDCGDEQCGGKLCGKKSVVSGEGNESREIEVDLYCIAQECQEREEIVEVRGAVCGNHICEEGEWGDMNVSEDIERNETLNGACAEDCSRCPEYGAIECNGRVIFSGQDENGCMLPPICMAENESCQTNENCIQPLCGRAECVENRCETSSLEECREQECTDGQERRINCENGEEIVSAICTEGLWRGSGVQCVVEGGETNESAEEEIIEEEIVGEACVAREDCGNANDVCSNGRCVTIPEVIRETPEEEGEAGETPSEAEEQETGEGEEAQPEASPTIEEREEGGGESEQEAAQSPSEVQESAPEQATTGNSIFMFISGLFKRTMRITGFSVEEGVEESPPVEASTETVPESPSLESNLEETPPGEGMPPEGREGIMQPPQEGEERRDNFEEERRGGEERRDGEESDRQDRERRDSEEREKRCKEDCKRGCYDTKVRPCVDSCIRKECGEEFECSVDEARKKCETECSAGENIEECTNKCSEKCMKGEKFWEDFEKERKEEEQHKEEKGVFKVGGMCRNAQQKTEGFIYFDGWGEPFREIQPLKHKYYSGGEADWCKHDFENLKKQRAEFEKGFNDEFVKWFFEKYLANSADEWEQHISGIFELFWKDVDISREMAFRMNCLGRNKLEGYNLISVKYETEYGNLEFWEEIKSVKLPGIEGEVEVISPYMKIWIFPPKSFIIYEMKKAMKEHEFPGPSDDKVEREKENGPTAEEKEMIKQDKKFMKMLEKAVDEYGGTLDAAVQFKDYEKNEIVFNLYAKVDKENILEMKPMLPEEMPAQDVRVEVDFEKIYELIYASERDMKGARIESPPWDRREGVVQKVKEVVNGVKMYFKIRSLMNSAKYEPKEAEDVVEPLFKEFFSMMMEGEGGGPPEEEGMEGEKGEDKGGDDVWESKEVITGEVLREI